MDGLTWCPYCPGLVKQADDKTWACTSCEGRWDAKRHPISATVPASATGSDQP